MLLAKSDQILNIHALLWHLPSIFFLHCLVYTLINHVDYGVELFESK